MTARRRRIRRVLALKARPDGLVTHHIDLDSPRTLRRTPIDFASVHLPISVRRALAEAFWSQLKVRSEPTIRSYLQPAACPAE